MKRTISQKVIFAGIISVLMGSMAISVINAVWLPPFLPTYTGCVKDIDGDPIQNALVCLYSDSNQVSIDYTDANGNYCVGNDIVINGYITVSKTNYLSQTKTVTSRGGRFDFILVRNVIPAYSGYIKTHGGEPIQNAFISLYGTNGYRLDTTFTDANGYYCVSSNIVKSEYLKVERDGYDTETRGVSSLGGYYNFYLRFSCWALVIGGEVEERFRRDAFGMYNTLIDYYGFTDDRIYLITTRSTIDGDTVPRDRTTSRDNVEWAINEIASKAQSTDQVIIWLSSHGNIDRFSADSDDITANRFDNYLDDINCHRMYIFLGQCHSGSFINNLDDEQNRAIYTSCNENQSGYGTYRNSYFPLVTYRALVPSSVTNNPDTNRNDKVSLLELFNYCVYYVNLMTDTWDQDQDPQSSLGSDFGIVNAGAYDYIGDEYY